VRHHLATTGQDVFADTPETAVEPIAEHLRDEYEALARSNGHRIFLCAKSANAIVGICEASRPTAQKTVVNEFITRNDSSGALAAQKLIEFTLLFASGATVHIPITPITEPGKSAAIDAGFEAACRTKEHVVGKYDGCLTAKRHGSVETIDITRFMKNSYGLAPDTVHDHARQAFRLLGEKPDPQDLWTQMQKKAISHGRGQRTR
jgi:hypothetical protein